MQSCGVRDMRDVLLFFRGGPRRPSPEGGFPTRRKTSVATRKRFVNDPRGNLRAWTAALQHPSSRPRLRPVFGFEELEVDAGHVAHVVRRRILLHGGRDVLPVLLRPSSGLVEQPHIEMAAYRLSRCLGFHPASLAIWVSTCSGVARPAGTSGRRSAPRAGGRW